MGGCGRTLGGSHEFQAELRGEEDQSPPTCYYRGSIENRLPNTCQRTCVGEGAEGKSLDYYRPFVGGSGKLYRDATKIFQIPYTSPPTRWQIMTELLQDRSLFYFRYLLRAGYGFTKNEKNSPSALLVNMGSNFCFTRNFSFPGHGIFTSLRSSSILYTEIQRYVIE